MLAVMHVLSFLNRCTSINEIENKFLLNQSIKKLIIQLVIKNNYIGPLVAEVNRAITVSLRQICVDPQI